MKVEPLQEVVPRSLISDIEAEAYFTRLHRFLRDLWVRTGGGSDRIEDNAAEASRPRSSCIGVSSVQGFHMGLGVPSDTIGYNGEFYFRTDGSSGSAIYHKESGSWAAIA